MDFSKALAGYQLYKGLSWACKERLRGLKLPTSFLSLPRCRASIAFGSISGRATPIWVEALGIIAAHRTAVQPHGRRVSSNNKAGVLLVFTQGFNCMVPFLVSIRRPCPSFA